MDDPCHHFARPGPARTTPRRHTSSPTMTESPHWSPSEVTLNTSGVQHRNRFPGHLPSPRDNCGVGINRLTPKSALIDDFALQNMDPTETADSYELVVARHHKTSTVLTSNQLQFGGAKSSATTSWPPIMIDNRLVHHAEVITTNGTQTVLG